MPELVVVHTADLDDAWRGKLRALLDDAFGEFEDADWEHGLGGLHAIVRDGSEPIAHGALVQRQLLHRGRALRTGYVEGVAVRADRRREGHAGAVMDALERVIRSAYELGALGAADDAVHLYESHGWERWRGRASVLAADGIRPTPEEEGSIYVLRASASLDLDAELTCDWREGDVW